MQAEDTSRSLQARARSLEGELAAARGKADEAKKALSQANAALERSECSRAEERDEASREREGFLSKCQGLVDRVETLQVKCRGQVPHPTPSCVHFTLLFCQTSRRADAKRRRVNIRKYTGNAHLPSSKVLSLVANGRCWQMWQPVHR